MFDLTTIQLMNEAAYGMSRKNIPIRNAIAPDVIKEKSADVKSISILSGVGDFVKTLDALSEM